MAVRRMDATPQTTSSANHPSNRIDELLPWMVAAKMAIDADAQDMPLAA